jgi:dienelactone hydrolase
VTFYSRAAVGAVMIAGLCAARPACAGDLASTLPEADTDVLSAEQHERLSDMLARDIEQRRRAAIQRENAAWAKVRAREDWERFRDPRLAALKDSLGRFGEPPENLNVQVTGRIEGEGYVIEKLVFESRPGLLVTANLYRPAAAGKKHSRPAILLSHSHHSPKTQGELQDMGVTWARSGCVVLVPDHLGHGERRQHPFVTQADYPSQFAVGRQDYYFRYNVGMQLHLVGESLMGWMVWDLMRCVDLLHRREQVDPDRIILIGAVAGGGDPAGVTAALDRRIAAVAPFNFGGPQPDYAIPEDAEHEFYFFGVAYWETTRCLRLGGRDGFAHWMIVDSAAPRGLIYSHEFGWQAENDPIWPRLEKVYELYGSRDRLGVAAGRGNLRGRPPENTHCGNVGAVHRSKIYPHLKRWFGMDPPEEYQQRRDSSELMCLTAELKEKLGGQPVYKLADELAARRLAAARREREPLDAEGRRKKLVEAWTGLLGDVTPDGAPKVGASTSETTDGLVIERIALRVEPEIVVPVLLLQPSKDAARPRPVIVAFARDGKKKLLAERAGEIAGLIEGGAAVCLPDLRGTGETSAGGYSGPSSADTKLSCCDQVLGQTLVASRLRDLRSVLQYLRGRKDLGDRIAVWGDSLAEANPKNRSEVVPHRVSNPNLHAEPTAGMVALLCGLLDEDVAAVRATGTFPSFRSLLKSQFLYVPHDAVVPGALEAGDVSDIAAAIAPRALRIEEPVDGVNRRVSADELASALAPAAEAYGRAGARERLSLSTKRGRDAAAWFLSSLEN